MSQHLTVEHIVSLQRELSQELGRRLAVVRDYVRAVAHDYATGLYLYGRPGTAKTHTVRAVLNQAGGLYAYQRGHLTPLGLFDLLNENAAEVVVLDDIGSVFRSDTALNILLAALEHPDPADRTRTRVVRYRRQGDERRVDFRGGVVCISNRELHGDDLLGAFKSRVNVLNYDPSDAQLGALMLNIADTGPAGVPPADARVVARHVIGESLRLGCPLDLRVFVNKALPCYQQWRDEETESDWRDLVSATIQEHLTQVQHPDRRPGRDERLAGERELVAALVREHPTREARVRAWVERTGKSERAFYRRLAELR